MISTVERATLLIAWLAISVLGAEILFRHWVAEGRAETAAITAGLFIAIVTGVFSFGTLFYAGQNVESDQLPAFDSYIAALKTSLIQQLVFLILTGLMLDGGKSFHVCVVAVAGFWPMALIILLRRPSAPKKSDLNVIRYGFFFVCFGVAILGCIVWPRLGRFGP